MCDVASLGPSLAAVDGLARLQLEARRRGEVVRLQRVSPALRELLDLTGLADVLGVEMGGQAEEREERLGLEEERHPGDPPA
jgi:anti-anti-sigma regulatory factor